MKIVVVLVLALLAMAAGPAAAPAAGPGTTHEASFAAFKRCGSIEDRGQRLGVWVRPGRFNCRRARSVIRHVVSHGRASQGSPGRGPRGWRCYWGYERIGSNLSRVPACSRRGVRVQATTAGHRPA